MYIEKPHYKLAFLTGNMSLNEAIAEMMLIHISLPSTIKKRVAFA
jgi:hypothetical protein